MKPIFIFLVLIAMPFCLTELIRCSDKGIISSDYVIENRDSDVTKAYNEIASCISLQPESDEGICCYMKLKFENELLDDEKFTQKGCVDLSNFNLTSFARDEFDFGDLKDQVEENINNANDHIEVKSIEIDCNSKFIYFAGMALLLFLL